VACSCAYLPRPPLHGASAQGHRQSDANARGSLARLRPVLTTALGARYRVRVMDEGSVNRPLRRDTRA
jgi:hypothetical protein